MKLGVNVDHVATLRQARQGNDPDPVTAARVCERAGAYAIVMHLREDRRHIQDSDIFRAKAVLGIKFNLEMSLAPSVVKIALKLRPQQVTWVPEKRQEMTTESGLDLLSESSRFARSMEMFRRKKIEVSCFIDPDPKQIILAKKLGAGAVEFHTGLYANQKTKRGVQRQLARLRLAVDLARQAGLVAHAGHGLDYQNVAAIARISGLKELNIGYSIISRAVWVGLETAVKEMNALIRS
ncbi:MAG: pyridoxine 5'-phosphate synthase [Candidatus Omnitrophica bacterium CG07_land_8_20_14_0_80_50_8]|nr:MAG: pyridoxine 5'-phosphate synthase [Candidatus Omnitrophica bacterium CG07_land_8_20_14_0_80_50_8]